MEHKSNYTLNEVAIFKAEVSNEIKKGKDEIKTKTKNLYLFIGFLFFCLISFFWSSLFITIPLLAINSFIIIFLIVKIVNIKNNLIMFEATLSIPPDEF